jgi:hypothetical protein
MTLLGAIAVGQLARARARAGATTQIAKGCYAPRSS